MKDPVHKHLCIRNEWGTNQGECAPSAVPRLGRQHGVAGLWEILFGERVKSTSVNRELWALQGLRRR